MMITALLLPPVMTLLAANTSAVDSPSHASAAYLTEVTAALEPVDGYVTRARMTADGRIISMVNGLGQICYDGWIQTARSASEEPVTLLSLGPNSLLAKEQGIFSSSPRLVAVVDANRYLLNVNCSESFPDPADPLASGRTGNVILYDHTDGSLTNLTRLNGASGRFLEGIEWLPEEAVLLVEESSLGSSDEPSPKRGNGRPLCLTLDGRRLEIEEFPRAGALYRSRRLIHSEWIMRNDGVRGQAMWTLRRTDDDRTLTFDIQAVDSNPRGPRGPRFFAVDADGTAVVVSYPTIGTWVADFEGSVRARISRDTAIDFDASRRLVLLQSLEREHGFSRPRFWFLDLSGYVQHLAAVIGDAGSTE